MTKEHLLSEGLMESIGTEQGKRSRVLLPALDRVINVLDYIVQLQGVKNEFDR